MFPYDSISGLFVVIAAILKFKNGYLAIREMYLSPADRNSGMKILSLVDFIHG